MGKRKIAPVGGCMGRGRPPKFTDEYVSRRLRLFFGNGDLMSQLETAYEKMSSRKLGRIIGCSSLTVLTLVNKFGIQKR